MKNTTYGKTLEIGDKIYAKGYTFEISKIISCDYWGDKPEDLTYNDMGYPNSDWGFYCEFIDTKGKYHYWKQMLDGGKVLQGR